VVDRFLYGALHGIEIRDIQRHRVDERSERIAKRREVGGAASRRNHPLPCAQSRDGKRAAEAA
jgi:hypothetical protein